MSEPSNFCITYYKVCYCGLVSRQALVRLPATVCAILNPCLTFHFAAFWKPASRLEEAQKTEG